MHTIKPESKVLPFLLKENQETAKLMSQADRVAALKKQGAESILDTVMQYIPYDSKIQPLTWAQLLKIPNSIPNQIFQSALIFDELRAEAVQYRVAEINIINETIKEAKAEAAASGHALGTAPLSQEESEAAGNYDENDNDTLAIEEQKKYEKSHVTMAKAAASMASLYHHSFDEVEKALEISPGQQDMTDEELNQWTADNEGADYDLIRNHLLGNVADKAEHFGFENVALVDKFLNRLTAMVMKNQMEKNKPPTDVENLSASVVGRAFDKHHDLMKEMANEMRTAVQGILKQEGASLTHTVTLPSPTPQPTFRQKMDKALLAMKADSLSKIPEETQSKEAVALRVAQVQLAAVQVMNPTQHTNEELKMKFPEPVDGAEKAPLTLGQIHDQLAMHAKQMGISVQVLVKAADRTLVNQLWKNDPASQQAINNNPVAEPVKKPSLMTQLMKDSMKHEPP